MGDPADLEFRPRSYRGPTAPQNQKHSGVSLEWKIAMGIFLGARLAILIHSVGSDNYTSAPNKKLIAKHCNPASDASKARGSSV